MLNEYDTLQNTGSARPMYIVTLYSVTAVDSALPQYFCSAV